MEPTASAPLIEARGLTKRYGDKIAVDHLDLDVRAGEVFGLLGPNGAGKTTTILMLLGLTEPTEGIARVAGYDPAHDALEVKRLVGYLPDAVGFYGGMTGRENLAYTARLNRLGRKDAAQRIADALDEVGLVDAADAPVATYSRGMRQRLGIADALIKEPAVLILDEPTMAIDPEGVSEIQALIRSLADDRGAAVLLSSHLLHQMQTICDRVGIFVAGKLVREGATLELLEAGSGSTSLDVEATGDPDVIQAALEAIPGVGTITRVDRHTWRISGSRSLAPQIASAIVESGSALDQLRVHSADLDEVYRKQFHGVAV